MSTLTHLGGASVRARAGRWAMLATAALVLALSVTEFVNLIGRHTIGAEIYGLLVAGAAVAAGICAFGLLVSRQRRVLATTAVLVLWAVVALGGVAGTYYHLVGVAAEYGPVDPRPRPVPAPLVFTLLGIAGGTVLFFGKRELTRRSPTHDEE